MLNQLLDQNKRYTFSDYFDVPLTVKDVIEGFGYSLEQRLLNLPALGQDADLSFLLRVLETNRRRTRLENEQARRAALVAPVLVEVCEYLNLEFDTEYPVSVSPHLTGIIDYRIEANPSILVVEAKESDLLRGFKQLAVEMIAASLWKQRAERTLSGVVTDGDRWQFAQLDPLKRVIRQDQKVYSIERLHELFGTIVGLVE